MGELQKLREDTELLLSTLDDLNRIHGARAGSWSWVQVALTFAIAALAGVTAAGVVADAGAWAEALAVTSAIFAAANLALKPEERREKHKAAADGYGELFSDVTVFLGGRLIEMRTGTGQTDELWDEYRGFGKRLAQIGKQTINVARALERRQQRRSEMVRRSHNDDPRSL